MPSGFKKVPAIDKCFAILDSLAQSPKPMGISDISGNLNLNKTRNPLVNLKMNLKQTDIIW